MVEVHPRFTLGSVHEHPWPVLHVQNGHPPAGHGRGGGSGLGFVDLEVVASMKGRGPFPSGTRFEPEDARSLAEVMSTAKRCAEDQGGSTECRMHRRESGPGRLSDFGEFREQAHVHILAKSDRPVILSGELGNPGFANFVGQVGPASIQGVLINAAEFAFLEGGPNGRLQVRESSMHKIFGIRKMAVVISATNKVWSRTIYHRWRRVNSKGEKIFRRHSATSPWVVFQFQRGPGVGGELRGNWNVNMMGTISSPCGVHVG